MEQWKDEIVQTEKAFSELAGKEGIPTAFLSYAAKDVVVMRNNALIVGWDALKESFNPGPGDNVSLSWEPDFVDVAASGDLGYTYGKYLYTVTDSLGNKTEQEGVFHTVWKRQDDGSWRFVWD